MADSYGMLIMTKKKYGRQALRGQFRFAAFTKESFAFDLTGKTGELDSAPPLVAPLQYCISNTSSGLRLQVKCKTVRTRDGTLMSVPAPGSQEETRLLEEETLSEKRAYQAKTKELKLALKENLATFERLTDSEDASSDDLMAVSLERQMMKRALEKREECTATHFELRGQDIVCEVKCAHMHDMCIHSYTHSYTHVHTRAHPLTHSLS